jgi:hypothetical protein
MGLIPITQGAKLASSWDLFLMRLPEAIIANEGNDHTSIYYVCSAEKALQALGKIFVTKRVSSIPEGDGHLPPAVGIRADILEACLGAPLTEAYYKNYDLSSRISSRSPKSEATIADLIGDLERQTAMLVGSF